jgi:hypothetical protein
VAGTINGSIRGFAALCEITILIVFEGVSLHWLLGDSGVRKLIEEHENDLRSAWRRRFGEERRSQFCSRKKGWRHRKGFVEVVWEEV